MDQLELSEHSNLTPEDKKQILAMRGLVHDLFKANAGIYYLDLFVTATIGWTAFVYAVISPALSVTQVAAAIVATFAHYRLLLFTHELIHLRRGEVPYFRLVWHLLGGMPLALPHFTYRGMHELHHDVRGYNSARDPEYVSFAGNGDVPAMVKLWLLPALIPILSAARYLLMAPISLFIPPMRKGVMKNASTSGMKIKYTRDLPTGEELKIWYFEEYSTSVLMISAVVLMGLGYLPWIIAPIWLIVMAGVFFLNTVRGFAGTHKYMGDGQRMRFGAHIRDSVNIASRNPLLSLVAPLGGRWHGLHHIFPKIPYHNLQKAHRRLVKGSFEIYEATLVPGLFGGLWQTIGGTFRNRGKSPTKSLSGA